ncbi:MAG: transporter substrate-binding domain-containing protein [Burkholderiaceae bacterium]
MKKLISAVAATLALALTGIGPVEAQESLKAATDCAYFPFSFKDTDGVLKGYEIDVGEDIARRANFKIEWVCQKFDGLIPSLLSNKFDIILAAMSITEERRKSIDFSVSYRVSVGQFVGAKGKTLKLFNADGTPNPAGFKDLRVGLGRATTYDNWMQAKEPEATIVRYDSDVQMYLDLKAGRVDVLMTNPMKIYLEFLSKPDGAGFEVIGPQIKDEKYFGIGVGAGLRKGNDALLKRIDAALTDMKKDGTMERYSKKYFPFTIY